MLAPQCKQLPPINKHNKSAEHLLATFDRHEQSRTSVCNHGSEALTAKLLVLFVAADLRSDYLCQCQVSITTNNNFYYNYNNNPACLAGQHSGDISSSPSGAGTCVQEWCSSLHSLGRSHHCCWGLQHPPRRHNGMAISCFLGTCLAH